MDRFFHLQPLSVSPKIFERERGCWLGTEKYRLEMWGSNILLLRAAVNWLENFCGA